MQGDNDFDVGAMELNIGKVCSSETLADFVEFLRLDLTVSPERWENPQLDMFLEAMEAYLRGMDSINRRLGLPTNDTPSWQLFAQLLYAGRIYE